MDIAQGFRGLGATGALMARQRLELAALDLEEEIVYAGRMFATALAVAVLGSLALAGAAAVVIIAFWDTARLAAAAGVTVVFAAAAAWLWISMARLWNAKPAFLAATIEQLRRDGERFGASS